MAIGDVKSDAQAVLTGARLSIQPPGAEEWVIHNIYREANATLEFFDGTDNIPFDVATGAGAWAGMQFHVTNAKYIRVVNNDAGTKNLGYDGVQTK